MDKDIEKTLKLVLNTLARLEVRGRENLGMVLGMIGLIEKALAALEEGNADGGE